MAVINKTGITNGTTIQAEHVTRAIDALSGGSTDTVIASGSFSGSLTGNATTATAATTATTATNATNTAVTNTSTGTGPYYITFVESATGNVAQRVDATGLTYNATTDTITATASYATTALSSSYAATASFALNAAGGGGGIFALTGSTYATTNNLEITGSLQVTAGVTASVQGTASYSNVSRNSEVVRASTNAAFFPVLVDSANATATAEALKSTTYLTINPSTDTISGATVSGSLNVSSSLTAQSNATVNFNSIGAQGNFSIPITALSAPTTGSMYWDDSTGILYIYSVTNAGWYNVQLNP
jgi:trimeric autotransporter adhesin